MGWEHEVAEQLLERARSEGVSLVGPGGLLSGVTKTVLETALDAELTEHLGYEALRPNVWVTQWSSGRAGVGSSRRARAWRGR